MTVILCLLWQEADLSRAFFYEVANKWLNFLFSEDFYLFFFYAGCSSSRRV